MDTRVILAARRRMHVIACLRLAAPACVVAAVLACIGVMIDRLPGGPFIDWVWVGPVLAGLTMIVVLAGLVSSRFTMHDAAVVLDERLEQHETFSTALALHDRGEEPVAALVLARADALSGAADIRRRMSAALRLPGSTLWLWTLALIVFATGLSFLGQLPGGGRSGPSVVAMDLEEARMDTDEAMDSVLTSLDDAPELKASLGDGFLDMRDVDARDPEALRRETVRSLSDLARRLEDIQADQELSGAMDAIEALESIPQVDPADPTSRLREALAAGDMAAAAQAAKSLSDLEGEDVAGAREALGEDLRRMAEQSGVPSEMLKRAGLDPDLARDPEALKKALDQNNTLTEQQKQDLREAASKCAGCRKQLTEMARQMQQVTGEAGEDSQKGGATAIEQLEQAQQCNKQASKCRSVCQRAARRAGSGMGTPMPGNAPRRGSGGGSMDVSEDETAIGEDAQEAGGVDATATIIESKPVRVPLPVGEAQEQASSPIVAAQRRLEEGLETRSIARRYREAVRAWFAGSVVEQTGGDGASVSASEGDSGVEDATSASGGTSGGTSGSTSGGGGGESDDP